MIFRTRLVLLATVISTAASLGACGSSQPPPKVAAVSPGGSKDPSKWPADDKSMCDWRNKPELEVSETAGLGAFRPNVRRVYKTFGEGESRHKTLVCREIDTNLDGIKDVVRTFNPKGEALHEEADTNYDGRVDVWMSFIAGRLAEEDVDSNFDGKQDVWKYYTNGQLSRVKRDRNHDGNPDVWEIYTNGKLERMGVDDSFDGHVDRWDRDEQVRLASEEEDRKAREKLNAGDGNSAPTAAPGQDAFIQDAGAPKPKATPKPATKAAPKK